MNCCKSAALMTAWMLQVQEAARRMAERMAQEPCGTQAAVDSFHRSGTASLCWQGNIWH